MIFKVMRIAGCLKERAFLHFKRIILLAHSIELMLKVFVDGDFECKYYTYIIFRPNLEHLQNMERLAL
jgi:hypothetical protein